MKLAIFANQKCENIDLQSQLLDLSRENGFEIDENEPEVVVFVGGDGTFLRAVHQYIDRLDKVKFIGVNCGSLGFFASLDKEECFDIFKHLQGNELVEEKHALLEADIQFEDDKKHIYAVNEIRIENPFHTLICDVVINNEYLETFRGNGLNIASEIGSSAYNKSLGGSLIADDLNAIELTEIASIQNNAYHTLASPLILSHKSKILLKGELAKSLVGYDHLVIDNNKLLSILIGKSTKQFTILRKKTHSYIKSIKRSFI